MSAVRPRLAAAELVQMMVDFVYSRKRQAPATFQGGSHQSVFRIALIVATLRQVRFVLGTLQPHLPLPMDEPIALRQLVLCRQRQLQLLAVECLKHALDDGFGPAGTAGSSLRPEMPQAAGVEK